METRAASNLLIISLICVCFVCSLHIRTIPQSVDLCKSSNCTCVNITQRKSIHCEGRIQGELPRMIYVPMDYTEIDFSRCDIPAIYTNTFEGIYVTTTLIKLDFSNNEIELIENASFEMFIGLRELILRRNKITNLTIAMFRGLRQLEKLDLSYNNIQQVHMDVLLPCISLKTLNLRYNLLPLQGLQDLLVSASSMLENLDLHATGLDRIPEDLFLVTGYLRHLTLSANNLHAVPGNSLRRLKLLSVLDLSDNPLTEIGSGDFEGQDNLEELYLNSMNQLIYIGEDAFHSLKNLKIFSCSYNSNLRAIHPGAFRGTGNTTHKWSLQEVQFRQNALNSIAEELLPWRKIRYIDLSENPWQCDCRISWMKSILWDLKRTPLITCAAPRQLKNRLLLDVPQQSLRCLNEIDSHMAASIILLLSTLFILSLACCFFACWKLNWFNICRAAFQKRYRTLKSPPEIANTGLDMEAPSDDTK